VCLECSREEARIGQLTQSDSQSPNPLNNAWAHINSASRTFSDQASPHHHHTPKGKAPPLRRSTPTRCDAIHRRPSPVPFLAVDTTTICCSISASDPHLAVMWSAPSWLLCVVSPPAFPSSSSFPHASSTTSRPPVLFLTCLGPCSTRIIEVVCCGSRSSFVTHRLHRFDTVQTGNVLLTLYYTAPPFLPVYSLHSCLPTSIVFRHR
jgi:hypothetical protein